LFVTIEQSVHTGRGAVEVSELAWTIYTPESPLRRPGLLIRRMARDLVDSRELAWRLFVRDISAQYRQSILGYVWVFVPPLVASLPFVYLNAQGIVRLGATPIPYGAYAIIGTIIWQVFVDAVNAPLRTVASARPMLARINLRHEAILLSALAQVVLGFLVRLVLLIGVLFWFRIVPPATALLLPVGILSLILTGFVVGMVLTPLGILYGDVQQALPVATTFLMFLTPILYPAPRSGIARVVADLNPLTPLVTVTRDWVAVGSTGHLPAFMVMTALALICLLVGWLAVRLAMPHLIARIGS
jgi:lipopolysaccharide transport system permease protein